VIAPPVLETHEGFVVVRDDLVPGGTKRRIIPRLLGAAGEYVYAGPAYGYAQIALAHACREAGKRATVFVAKRGELHPRTREANHAGARVVQVPHGYLSNVRAKAKAYAAAHGAELLPFGLDVPAFHEGLAELARSIGHHPREVWVAAGSGALCRALRVAWPEASFHAVRVGAALTLEGVTVHEAPEAFERDARVRPPFPSCSNYDAKVWQFMRVHAAPGALFWNVAA
jgi:hypothetical protein